MPSYQNMTAAERSFLTEDNFTIVTPNRAGAVHKSNSPKARVPKSKGKANTSKASPNTAPTKAPDGTLSTFRSLGCKKRDQLFEGQDIELRTHDSAHNIDYLKLALFETLSTKPEILSMFEWLPNISLPAWTHPAAVKELVARVQRFAHAENDVEAMESTGEIFKDVHIISVAEFLGLTAYTQALFNMYFHKYKTTATPMATIDTLCKVPTPTSDKLLNIVAFHMASLSWEGTLPSLYDFQLCLERNPRFEVMVNGLLAKWTANGEAFAAREKRRQAKAEGDRKSAERRDKEKIKFAHLNKEDAELGEVVRDKMRKSGSKYNACEAQYVMKTFCKRVPVAANI